MAQYYKIRTDEFVALNIPNASITPSEGSSSMTEFDRHRETLLAKDVNEGPASELCRYLATMQRKVKKDTDIVEWWQVSFFVSKTRIATKLYSSQEHANVLTYIQHSHESLLMSYHRKHHQCHANGYSQVPNRSPLIVGHA